MGGQAAGHPHLWETDPAVRPLTEQAERDGTHLAWRPMLWLRAVFIKNACWPTQMLSITSYAKSEIFLIFHIIHKYYTEGKMYFWNALAIQVQNIKFNIKFSSTFEG